VESGQVQTAWGGSTEVFNGSNKYHPAIKTAHSRVIKKILSFIVKSNGHMPWLSHLTKSLNEILDYQTIKHSAVLPNQ
jgi:hypothetical protein